jgi:NADPH-dependent curcumin reductase CurA
MPHLPTIRLHLIATQMSSPRSCEIARCTSPGSPLAISMIHTAAGGVGGFAVQFARWKGAHVIGTTSPANMDHACERGSQSLDIRAA